MKNNFQYEYDTEDFIWMTNKILIYPVKPLFEEYHVIKAIEKCSEELSIQIIRRFVNLNPYQRVNETYFSTDWYIRSKIDDFFDIENTMLTKTKTNHNIMFSFQKMKGIDMQNIKRQVFYSETDKEELRQNIFKENLIEDNPKIIISFDFIKKVIEDDLNELFVAILNHEIRHVVEQYILEFDNTLTNRKNSLYTDFKENNIFKLDKNSKIYQYIYDVLYYLTKEEQRARIQATWSICQNIKKNNKLYSALTSSYNVMIGFQAGHPEYNLKLEDNLRKFVFSVLRMQPFNYVHRLNQFSKIINIPLFELYKKDYKELLILGYYMYKHNYLYIYTENFKEDGVKQFFSYKNIVNKLNEPYSEDDKKFYYIVLKSIHRNFYRYQNIIYNTVGSQVKKLFNIRENGESIVDKYNQLAADNDLSLTDEEVIMINESYNAYQYTLQRELLGMGTFW